MTWGNFLELLDWKKIFFIAEQNDNMPQETGDNLPSHATGSIKSREELADIRSWGYDVDTQYLYDHLKAVDPISAQRIHPHDQRKLIRLVFWN